jgi:hypothetical protein
MQDIKLLLKHPDLGCTMLLLPLLWSHTMSSSLRIGLLPVLASTGVAPAL